MNETNYYVSWVDANNQSQTVLLSKQQQEIVVGRSPTADVVLTDPSVSRSHLKLYWQDDLLVAEDTHSSTGTLINGSRLNAGESRTLYQDSEIRLGGLSLWLEVKKNDTNQDLLQTIFFPKSDKNDVSLSSEIQLIREALVQNIKNHISDEAVPDGLVRLLDSELHNLQSQYEERIHEQKILHSISHMLNGNLGLSDLCRNALDLASKVLNADRGCIVLWDKQSTKFEVIAERNFQDNETQLIQQDMNNFSRNIVKQCLTDKEVIIINNTDNHVELQDLHSINQFDTRSIAAIPLFKNDKAVGAIYLDSKKLASSFKNEQIPFMETFAAHTSVALNNAQLYKRAITDDLTHLFTRKYINDRLHLEVERAHRYKRPFSLLLLDIDHFKKVNDTHGHNAGDMVLKAVSNILSNALRETDVAGRFGGEEFIIVLGETDRRGAEIIAERIRKAIEKLEVTVESIKLNVTVSIGVNDYQRQYGHNIQSIIDDTDKALYQAKTSGRNQVVTFK